MGLLDDLTVGALELPKKGLDVASGADSASGEWVRDAIIPLDMVYDVRNKYRGVF